MGGYNVSPLKMNQIEGYGYKIVEQIDVFCCVVTNTKNKKSIDLNASPHRHVH